MIFPEIFDGLVMGFFTGREMGIDVGHFTRRKVYLPVQKHTNKIIVVKDDLAPKVADAAVTDRNDIMLGVQVADCVPILLFEPDNSVTAAVHAGWRGTATGILKRTIETMEREYGASPEDIHVAIGPAIRKCCYEVGGEVFDAVWQESGPGNYHEKRDGKLFMDLQLANRAQALSMGVREERLSVTEECTCCSPSKYHSYRRDKGTTGRQGGFIGMP